MREGGMKMLKKIIAGVALVAIIATGTFFVLKNIDKKPEPQETEAEQTESEETEEEESADDTEAEETKESDDVERLTVDDILDEFGYSDLEGLYSGVPQSDINNYIADWLMKEGNYGRPNFGLYIFDGMELPVVDCKIVVDDINASGSICIAIEPDHGETFLINTTIPFSDGSALVYNREVNELPTHDESVEDIVNEYNNQ